MWHDGLKKHRLIRGETHEIVQLKAQLQADEWDARWSVVNARQRDNADRLNAKSLAAAKTADAQQEMERLESILRYTLNINDAIDWEGLKDKSPFPERRPAFGEDPVEPQRQALPREPQSSDLNYLPQFSLLDKLFTSRRERIKAAKQAVFEADLQKWKKTVADLTAAHAETTRTFEQEVQVRQEQHRVADLAWQKRKNDYSSRQLEANAAVDRKRAAYESLLPEAVIEYCDLVLSKSDYPDYFPQEFELSYDSATKALVVDYVLPSPDALPTLKAVKYVASRDEIEEQHISDGQAAKLFDDVLYQTVLRTLHELFESDTVFALSTVVINGIVTAISQSTGKPVTSCVLSLRANRDEFLSIDLARVDPKTCFKALKGVGSSKLYGLSPVAPIMPLRREDGRFVSAYEVASTLDASVNLAAMDWEDFEHLIREVFEQEFSSGGGEVKVTQASRDGGVDAIAFDPDPIRGGKIVIQAKRYTNTVGVAAVRDLYGTVLNEGATKGILVTTSDYGPDSYSFANGKPLVLLSGANLLHMLEKHGHRARIDLRKDRR
jgi:restriction system protein